MRKPDKIRQELAETRKELAEAGYAKPQFLIDDDDEYQDQLELGWYKSELEDKISALEEELKDLERSI